jgi:hypothetical protein
MIRNVLALLAAAVVGGCFPCGDDSNAAFSLEVEACGLCNATVDSEGGSVTVVDSFHPGEQGLRFVGPVTATFPVAVDIGADYQDGAWIDYIANCPGVPAVDRIVQPGGSLLVELRMPPFPGEGLVDHGQILSLPPLPGPDDPYAPDTGNLTAVRVIAPAGADCVIDQFTIRYATACAY